MLRGLGKGGGFDEVERYSLLDGSDPELLGLISDRVAVIYDLLYARARDSRLSIDKSAKSTLEVIKESHIAIKDEIKELEKNS